MQLNPNVQTKLIEQVVHELSVSNFYACASTIFDSHGAPNLAAWAMDQASEERGHSNIFLGYLSKRGVVVTQFDVPSIDVEENISIVDLIGRIASLETDNFSKITDIFNEARAALDPATEFFLADIIREQVEEVDVATTFADMANTDDDEDHAIELDLWAKENLLGHG
jgi:ferritin